MSEFLFNVSVGELAGSQLQFAWPVGTVLLAMAAALVGALFVSGYLSRPHQPALAVLRGAIALVLALLIAQPQLLVRRADSTSGSVAVLIDSSASMSVTDADGGRSRLRATLDALDTDTGAVAGALQQRFNVRWLHYDASVRDAHSAPSASRVGTAVSDPLQAMLDAASATDVSALVLVSDGGQISGVDERELLARLQVLGVPVHVLGVGDERLTPDLAVRDVVLPARVLNGDEVDVRVQLHARDLSADDVHIVVFNNDVLAGERALTVDSDDFERTVTIPITVDEAGMRRIDVRVEVPAQDRIAQNNDFSSVLHVRPDAVRVLHFEAEPRFEVKFVRRALANDKAIALASLVRTGDNRYLRLGIDSRDQLAEGFPVTAEELFRYQVLIIGSANVANFSAQQLQLLERFVAQRGGSVLFLGGRGAFAEGGWGTESLARLFPVWLQAADESFNRAVSAQVTAAGRVHPVTRGLFDGAGTRNLLALPELAMVNPLRRPKPGATVLLRGDDGSGEPLLMLAWHRFGAGRVAVLPVRDTWRWRMHADVPLDDRTHELFWRRLVRWLAREVADPISARVPGAGAAPGQRVPVEIVARDAAWQPVTDVPVRVTITSPAGDLAERVVTALPVGEGLYGGRFLAQEPGIYRFDVVAQDPMAEPSSDASGASAGALTSAAVMVRESGEEFLSPSLHRQRLERFAAATGGSYRHLDAAGDLAARIATSVPGVPSWQRVPLWNAPFGLLLLLLLACGEWWLRRQRRQLP